MAETLDVVDMIPNRYEPKRKFRFILAIEGPTEHSSCMFNNG